MKPNPKEIKLIGKENGGVWDKEKKGFKLSIRWNETDQLYECYKLYFDTDEEEILYHHEELTEILKRTQALSNYYAENLA